MVSLRNRSLDEDTVYVALMRVVKGLVGEKLNAGVFPQAVSVNSLVYQSSLLPGLATLEQ